MMSEFNPKQYGTAFAPLLAAAPLNELGPGLPVPSAKQRLAALASVDALTAAFAPHKILDQFMTSACLAGLWLRYDFFDESHSISQEINSSTGSFWHGILHRREPDYGNAKYWFRHVGRHPTFASLREDARALAAESSSAETDFLKEKSQWDPFAFVDFVAETVRQQKNEQLCREIQRREWELLFDFSYRAAIGQT